MEKVKKVRPILQTETTECGAASLAMILAYYGKTVTIEELRRECGVSRNGVNAKNIVKAAKFHNLTPRALRVSVDDAKELKTPAIIHWNMDHFLVLCGFNKKGAVLADPAFGMRTVPPDEFSKSFTGIAIEFTPDADFQKDKGGKASNYIGSCVKAFLPYTAYFVLLEICALIAGAAVLFLNSVFIDKILIGGNMSNLKIILQVILCAGLITAAAAALDEHIGFRIGRQLNMRINSGFIDHLLRLPIEFFAQRSEGDLANRQSTNMEMGAKLARMMSPIPGYIMKIIVYFILIIVFDAHIAFVGILCAAANVCAMLVSMKKYEEQMRSYSRDLGALQGDISRTIDIVETIKSCGAEDAMFNRLTAAGTQAVNTKTQIDKTGMRSNGLFSFLNALGSGVVLITRVWKILSGDMTAGILISLQSLVAAMLEPLGNIVNAGVEMQTINSEISRANDVMRYREDDKFLDDNSEHTKSIDGDISLNNVTFGYNPLDDPFIKILALR